MKWLPRRSSRSGSPDTTPAPQLAADRAAGEPPDAGRISQINIRTDDAILDRFKRMCRDDRRTYGDMLRILMERQDSQG